MTLDGRPLLYTHPAHVATTRHLDFGLHSDQNKRTVKKNKKESTDAIHES
jgi:hypothetical protein